MLFDKRQMVNWKKNLLYATVLVQRGFPPQVSLMTKKGPNQLPTQNYSSFLILRVPGNTSACIRETALQSVQIAYNSDRLLAAEVNNYTLC